jgi:transcriptional regulator with XRE-family HTH domain
MVLPSKSRSRSWKFSSIDSQNIAARNLSKLSNQRGVNLRPAIAAQPHPLKSSNASWLETDWEADPGAEVARDGSLSKAEMAVRMKTSRAAVDRLLDASNSSVTLATLNKAASALGRKVKIELVPA